MNKLQLELLEAIARDIDDGVAVLDLFKFGRVPVGDVVSTASHVHAVVRHQVSIMQSFLRSYQAEAEEAAAETEKAANAALIVDYNAIG